MASILKVKNGKWRARVRPEPGAPQVCRHFDTKAAAEAWVTTTKADALRGTVLDHADRKTTVKEYAEKWRSGQPHRPRTACRVASVLRCQIYPALGSRPIASLRRSEVQSAVGTWSSILIVATLGAPEPGERGTP